MRSETIAAIATAMSNSGIGIIRISGDNAIAITDAVYINKKKQHSLKSYRTHTIHYGFICDSMGEVIDEVMVSVMKAPNSYTMEDTVEINCHGGVLIMNQILELVVKSGARIAEPGEYTKRAFLNGRIDLSRAEAVMDVIDAKNKCALKSSVNQMKGAVSELVKEMRASIIYEIAFIESALDDPEHISLEGYQEKLAAVTKALIKECEKLLCSSENGRILKEGINTVIVGKPNAGKSSLLNVMLGQERAIVTDIAGTTRDILEEQLTLGGINLNMIDTAGIRSTEDVVEKIGVERAKKYAEDADLIIYVVDSSVPLDQNDEVILNMLKHKKVIVLLNKSDLVQVIDEAEIRCRLKESKIIKASVKDMTGISEFERDIQEMFIQGKIEMNEEVYLTNMRHKEAIEDTLQSLKQVQISVENQMPEDFYSIDLMSAYSSLGYIIGEEVSDDLVNEIFSKFCMGK